VLSVVHLVFTTGHTAPAGEQLVRRDLVERSIDLARMLHALLPGDREVAGLLALILLTNARSPARTTPDGELVLLADQDRSRWDRDAIAEGLALAPVPPAGRFALMAAIAAAHSSARSFEDTPWPAIVALYDALGRAWPSPVVALNRAAALGFARGPQAGLDALDALDAEPALATYGYLAAARADFLSRLGRAAEARAAYEEALLLTENAVERGFLERRLAAL
jgi:RNA polymerase sigma-70 factor (ECF subfamily)